MTDFESRLKRSHHEAVRSIRNSFLIALLSGLAVCFVLMAVVWNVYRSGSVEVARWRVRQMLRECEFEIATHLHQHGEIPEFVTDFQNAAVPRDSWNHQLKFEFTDAGVSPYSLGRDGTTGGRGLDADIFLDYRNELNSEPTFEQFFFRDQLFVDFVVPTVAAAVAIAIAVFTVLLKSYDSSPRASIWDRALYVFMILIFSCVVCSVLLALHEPIVPNGH